jgi:hypothetical protein
MSDTTERPYLDTVVIRAALVFPGDTPLNMGFDTCRIPVRVVWHSLDPVTPVATGGTAEVFRGPPADAQADGNAGGDDPTPGAAGAPEPERAASGEVPGADPVVRFLRINETLDRITEGGVRGKRRPSIIGTSVQYVPVATDPVPVANDKGAAAARTRSTDAFDQRALEEVGYKTKNVNNSTARDLGMSRDQLGRAIHTLKRALGLRGDDDLEMEVPPGDVFHNGEKVGNLHDE